MNALNELLDTHKLVTEEELKCITDTPEYTVEFGKTQPFGEWKGYSKVTYHYKPTSSRAKKWVNSIAFAKIYCDGIFDEPSVITELRSNHTESDELRFLKILASIDYDNGYGGQELFGTIVFKDGTWLERGEYDGSEWWEHRKQPTEESLFGNN